ncbi:MAG TPA: hypothetical protein VFP72_05980 [Kineosporiaceae bacterium]|nr:hypothetical protein [Kineosporiaceae bacterium]
MSDVISAAVAAPAVTFVQSLAPTGPAEQIQLSPSVDRALRELCARKRISITEGVRRAIAIWKFLEEQRTRGNRVAIVERTAAGDRIREVVLKD